MTIAKWADYSQGRPTGSDLRNAGFVGVIRYIGGGSAGKRLNKNEYQNLVANGLQVKLVFELGIHDAEAGYASGVANATAALADARSMGVPDTVVIYAASDEHLTTAQVSVAVQYVKGFRDVLGLNRTGVYGFSELVDAVHDAGYAHEYWKCGTAPTANQKFVTFWQRNQAPMTQTVDGVIIDIDDQELSLTTEADVQFSDQVTDNGPGSLGHVLLNLDQIIQDLRNGVLAQAILTAPLSDPGPNTPAHVLLNLASQFTQGGNQVPAIIQALSDLKTQVAISRSTVDTTALESAIAASVQTAVTAAVTAGLQGLALTVSPSAIDAIAQASGKSTVAALKGAITLPAA